MKSAAHTTATICVPIVEECDPGGNTHVNSNSNGYDSTLLESLAHQLGQEAFEKAKDQASEVVGWEKLRREKANLPEIATLKSRYDCLFRSHEEFLEALRQAPSGNPDSLLHRRWCYRAFALVLVVAGIFFAHLALAPFGLGPEAWVLCLGIGCVAPFWTERKGYDGKTDYEKNVEAACGLITHLPPGTQVTVFAITDRSFSQPYILLQRELPTDKGPLQFQDRIAIAKAQAAAQLRKLALSSPRSIPHTDIFGALILAADMLRQSSRRKALVLFSDMRQSTSDTDFERLKTISRQTLATVERQELIARLQNVDLYVLGVDGTGKSLAYWNSLRDFWEAYFHKAGANLKKYSTLRDASVANEE